MRALAPLLCDFNPSSDDLSHRRWRQNKASGVSPRKRSTVKSELSKIATEIRSISYCPLRRLYSRMYGPAVLMAFRLLFGVYLWPKTHHLYGLCITNRVSTATNYVCMATIR